MRPAACTAAARARASASVPQRLEPTGVGGGLAVGGGDAALRPPGEYDPRGSCGASGGSRASLSVPRAGEPGWLGEPGVGT